MVKKIKRRSKTLPPHPKKHHKPFRWRHVGLFLTGLALGVLSTYRTGYFAPLEFDVNSVSPATVRVYHFVCGVLVVDGVQHGGDVCDGNVGSGFLVSSDGYVATSGHVVVRNAADILVGELKNNPSLLQQYLLSSGSTYDNFTSSDGINSILASIYDRSNDRLRLENKKELTLVALGDRPVTASNQADIRRLFNRADDEYIKKAKMVATDYQAKDLLVIEQKKNPEGFTASDMALLKINVSDAPFIRLADTSELQQNDPISLIGFPSDADNQLTANNIISPSVTNGTINNIRVANGSSSRLFQTDADASTGSSGGPAVNQNGKAIGVVTYRFKDSNSANSAKSYIRDIEDLRALLKEQSVSLNTSGAVQSSWEEALRLARQNKFSSAIDNLRYVQSTYPAHRLVNIYGNQYQQSVDAGKDYKDPKNLIITIAIAVVAIVGLIVATVLIIRHHRHHRRYRQIHTRPRQVIKPSKK